MKAKTMVTIAKKTRMQELGDFGECRALHKLRNKNYSVEKMPRNFPFFDLMAKRGTYRLLIPVRTRNKFTAKGAVKTDHYNLYTKNGHFASANKIASFFGAKIAWIVVTVDTETKTYSAYMGNISTLPSPKRIPMHPTHDVPNYKPLAENEPDAAIQQSWSNVQKTVRA